MQDNETSLANLRIERLLGREELVMVRIYGKALVATWRPYEDGGKSTMRTAQIESEHVTVLNDTVVLQLKDGLWATYPLLNCSIIWETKPSVTLVTDEDKETTLPISGEEHTLADSMHYIKRGPTKAMTSSDEEIRGR